MKPTRNQISTLNKRMQVLALKREARQWEREVMAMSPEARDRYFDDLFFGLPHDQILDLMNVCTSALAKGSPR